MSIFYSTRKAGALDVNEPGAVISKAKLASFHLLYIICNPPCFDISVIFPCYLHEKEVKSNLDLWKLFVEIFAADFVKMTRLWEKNF